MEKTGIAARIKLFITSLCLAALCLFALVFVGCDGNSDSGGGDEGKDETVHKIVYIYEAETGGKISGESRQELTPNGYGAFVRAEAQSGYRFIKWSDGRTEDWRYDDYDDSLVGPDEVTEITYTAEFKPVLYARYLCGKGGQVLAGLSWQSVIIGETAKEVTAQPDKGYKFLAWSDGVATPNRKDTLTDEDLTVTAYFRPIDMSGSYTAGRGGSVVLSYNDDGLESTVTATATPDEGYDFVGWSDSETSPERTDNSIAPNMTFIAEFAKKVFTIRYNVSGHGFVSRDSQTVNYGDDASYVTAFTTSGYEFAGWSDGVETPVRTDKNVKSDISVTAVFVKKEYTFSYSATVGGEVVGELNQTVKFEENGTSVTAVAKPGYSFVRWSDGVPTAERTDVGLGNMSVVAEFAKTEFSVIYESSDGGSISGDAEQVVLRNGSAATVVAVADDGYEFVGWSDGMAKPERTDRYVTDDILVTANFEPTLIFTLNSDETGYIVKARNGYKTTEIEIPAAYNGLPVTEIGYNAFEDGVLSAITIPDTVKKIGTSAFAHIKTLTEIYIPDSVEIIGSAALALCNNLQSVTGMNCVKSLGDIAFYGCPKLDNLVLPATLNSLGSKILKGYENTVYVQMSQEDMEDLNPEWADEIGDTAEIIYTVRSVLYTLTYIASDGGYISGGSVQYVATNRNGTTVTAVAKPGYEFAGWSDGVQTEVRQDRAIKSDITVTATFSISLFRFTEISDTECSVRLVDKTATKVVVPARTSINGKIYTVTAVAVGGFMSAQSLTEVVLPDTVTTIGSSAFANCQSLTSVTFGNVQIMGNSVFARCSSLESIVIPETVTSAGSNMFRYCNTKVYVRAAALPEGWHANWNENNENQDVVFGYQD